MKFHVLAILLVACVLPRPARAQEQKIQRSALPPAVERTVAQQSKGATIRGFSKEIDHGQTLYEVALTVNGRGKDVSMDSSGTVVEIEEQMTLDLLPPLVLQGITAQAGANPVRSVERLTKFGQVVAYEAHVTINGKPTEVQVGPQGEKLDHEE